LISIIAAVFTAVCFYTLSQAQDPAGGDGYFYLKQMEVLAKEWRFYHADYSFIFLPLVILFKISGSSLLAYQLVTCGSYFLILYVIGVELLNSFKSYAFVSTVVFLFALGIQPALLHLCFEFPKNGFAVALLLTGMRLYRRRTFIAANIFFVLALLTHKIVILFFGLWLVYYSAAFLKDRKRILGVSVLTFALLGVSLLVFPKFIYHIQNYIQNFKIEVIPFFSQESQLISNRNLYLILVWLLMSGWYLKTEKQELKVPLLALAFIPFLPIFSGVNIEIKYRLFLVSFIFSMLLFVYTLPLLKNAILKKGAIAFSLAVLLVSGLEDNEFPWITPWSEKITNLNQLQSIVRSSDYLVTHHGLQFYIDYKTPIRARSLLSANSEPAYQVAYVPEFYHLNPGLSDKLRQIELLKMGSEYSLFYFAEFQKLIQQNPILKNWRNHFQVRPAYVSGYE
jgi:hypothetical protein